MPAAFLKPPKELDVTTVDRVRGRGHVVRGRGHSRYRRELKWSAGALRGEGAWPSPTYLVVKGQRCLMNVQKHCSGSLTVQ